MNYFLQKLDIRFLLAGEMLKGRGEDCFYSAQTDNSAIAAVFDGCGGLGSRRYLNYSGHTGAYMASRAAGGALRDWYQEREEAVTAGSGIRGAEEVSGPAVEADRIREHFGAAMKVVLDHAGQTSGIFGTMVRDFPTTAAAALVVNKEGGTELDWFWAGDSRVYLMDREGLAQLTQDDVEGEGAMSNLRADGALTNLVAADREYTLHAGGPVRLRDEDPYMVFAATDGCFGYLPTPMDFEDMILTCLLGASSPADFQQRLKESIEETAGDDYTLAFMSFGFGNFKNMQESMKERKKILQHDYMDWMEQDPSLDMQERLWEEYRVNYERFLGKKFRQFP